MQAAEQQQALYRRRDYTDELLRAFPGAQVVNAEGSVVDLPFQLPTGRSTALRVSLSQHFPHDRPVLCVLVPLQHPSVDPSGRVHVRGLERWGALGAHHLFPQRVGIPTGITPPDLVAVIREAFEAILGEATAAKQGLLGGPAGVDGVAGSPARGRDGQLVSLTGGLASPSAFYDNSSNNNHSMEPSAFMEGLPTARLREMLENEAELKKAAATWLKDTPAARALEDVRRQNRAAAEDNQALARAIEEARGHVAIVRSGDYAAMRALFEELYKRQEAVLAKMGTNKLLERLRQEADKADAASDEVLDRFQMGSLSVEAFVEQYVAAREAFHITDLKRQAAEHSNLT
ncbi:hypothetical protein Vretimale_12873 [Volvox reticuliferus]|uniref:Uncharacterized protein n=1 Tax=Volvox reticuliferus TaxID=1737510 RepID=A0A8J4GL82_9CHLO|nr:hypothetical protein Vretifemale_9246 [Volvox reticuliferus]GIM08992.1 hypothetical protein Vretimale_12873 [Volvox reticuliferus]